MSDPAAARRGAPSPLPTERSVAAIYAALGAIALAPLLVFEHPAFTDHPNHLARLHVLVADADSPIRAVYEPAWALIPNIALDAFAVAMHPWLTPEAALQAATVGALAGILLGVALLQRRLFGALDPLAWFAVIPVFNLATSMGYVNYLIGAAIALLALPLWLAWAGKPAWWRVLAFNAIGTALFFSHVAALGFFGLVIGAYELARAARREGLAVASIARLTLSLLATFALPLGLALLADRPHHVATFSYAAKARMALAPTWIVPAPAFLLGFVALALLLYEGVRSRQLHVARTWRAPLLLLLALTLALPSKLSLLADLDARVFVCVVFLAISVSRLAAPSRTRVTALALALLAVVAARSLVVANHWRAWSEELDGFRAAIARVEPGAALLVAEWDSSSEARRCATARPEPPHLFWHVPSLAVVDRAAFTPLLFTGAGMQPVRPTAAYRALDTAASSPVPHGLLERAADPEMIEDVRRSLDPTAGPGYFLAWPETFDYLVFLHGGCPEGNLRAPVTKLSEGGFYTLYRIKPGSGRFSLQDDSRTAPSAKRSTGSRRSTVPRYPPPDAIASWATQPSSS